MSTLPTEAEIRAMPAGRRLDAWVAEHVMGWVVKDESSLYWEQKGKRLNAIACVDDWKVSSSWAETGPLLEAFGDVEHVVVDLALREVVVTYDADNRIVVPFWLPTPNDLCRAICVARLLATLATKEQS